MSTSYRVASLALAAVVLATVMGCRESVSQIESVRPYEIVELVPGVWAAVATTGGHGAANAGIMDLGEMTFLYDSGLTPEAGRFLAHVADSLTGKNVGLVINSHYHDDHIGGNQVFSDITIISTSATKNIIESEGLSRSPIVMAESRERVDQLQHALAADPDERTRRELMLLYGYYGGIVDSEDEFIRAAPNAVWDHRLNFTGSLRRIKIVPVGKAHADGDAPLIIQGDSVLFASDLVTTDRHPLMENGDPDGWASALDTLLSFQFNVLVPGHGPLGDRQSVLRMRDYLQSVESAAEEVIGGKPWDEVEVDSAFSDWLLAARYRQNVRFVAEFRSR